MDMCYTLLIIATTALGAATIIMFKLNSMVSRKEKTIEILEKRLKNNEDSSVEIYNEKLKLRAKVARLERELKEGKPKAKRGRPRKVTIKE